MVSLDAEPAAGPRRFPGPDQKLARAVLGLRQPPSVEAVVRRIVSASPRVEDAARIHFRSLPAPAALGTEPPVIDDPLMTAVVAARAARPRWEGAWHLRGDIRVSPGHPHVFAGGRFVAASAGFEEADDEHVWRHYLRRALRRPLVSVDRAVLVREPWEGNYWHLLDGVLPRFVMASALGIDPAVPAIVSRELIERHGARVAGTGFLTERPLVIQEPGVTVRCRELFLLRPCAVPSHLTPGMMERIPVAGADDAGSPPRRVYFRRAPQTGIGRTAENTAEIDEIFRAAGFAVVDPTDMTVVQQRAMFGGAEVIAGINGAAFANGLFRCGKALTIGSLISANWMSTVFPTMARVHGFRFIGHVVPPTGGSITATVVVPPDTARRLIDRIA